MTTERTLWDGCKVFVLIWLIRYGMPSRLHPTYDTLGPSSSSPLYILAFSQHRRSLLVVYCRLFLAKGCGTLVLELLVESVTVTDSGDVVALYV